MSTYNPREQQPVRRELTDPRSSHGPAAQGMRKTILNDMRSTRWRPA
ncbi:MAG TPA: hypothetical protein VLI41_07535 [Phenylobacterium sp.]|nr:hypothetical protein [Phenylobacterium sp.]HSV03045.1 hypothetical protein [Phenylobacterium sp.]